MTTLFSSPAAEPQTLTLRRGRAALAALWLTQVGVAGMMLMAGGMKVSGASEMVALFDTIGTGQWFRYVTGGIEVISAVALRRRQLDALRDAEQAADLAFNADVAVEIHGDAPAEVVVAKRGLAVVLALQEECPASGRDGNFNRAGRRPGLLGMRRADAESEDQEE